MENINQYIFSLYRYYVVVRETLNYVNSTDISSSFYLDSKNQLLEALREKGALRVLIDNEEKVKQALEEKLNNFISDFYSETSSIFKIAGDMVRVDHSQNIKIIDDTTTLCLILKNIIVSYVIETLKKKTADQNLLVLFETDDRYYLHYVYLLTFNEFKKSFEEFNKLMVESKGVPTPQSNFVAQNELMKLSNILRKTRSNHRVTDNETLDLMDDTLKIIEMVEGRRDRINNKSFAELFNDMIFRLNDSIKKPSNIWISAFKKCQESFRQKQNGEENNNTKLN